MLLFTPILICMGWTGSLQNYSARVEIFSIGIGIVQCNVAKIKVRNQICICCTRSIIQFARKIYELRRVHANSTHEPRLMMLYEHFPLQSEIQSQTKMIRNNILFHFNVDIIYSIRVPFPVMVCAWLAYMVAIGYFPGFIVHPKRTMKNSINFVTCEVYPIEQTAWIGRNALNRVIQLFEWTAPLCKYQ